MRHQKRRHAKAGRIANAQRPPVLARQFHRPRPTPRTGHMLDQIGHKSADQPDRQHLGPERTGKHPPVSQSRVIGRPKFTRAIYSRRPHQIPDPRQLFGIGLRTGGEPTDHMLPQPDRAVGPRQDQLFIADPPRFLKRYIGLQTIQIRRAWHPINQRKCGIPGLGNHPIRALLGRQIMRKGDKTITLPRTLRAIHGPPDTDAINLPNRAIHPPPVAPQPSQQHPHETEPRLMRPSQPRQAHDRLGWPQRDHGCGPNELAKNRIQLSPMIPATSSSENPTRSKPGTSPGKSRLSRKNSGCGGNPGAAAEPSP